MVKLTKIQIKIINKVFELIDPCYLKDLTMDKLASELKMSKKTIYKHFPSKKSIIHCLLLTYVSDFKEKTPKFYDSNISVKKNISHAIFTPHSYKISVQNYIQVIEYYPDQAYILRDLQNFKIKIIYDFVDHIYEQGKIKKNFNLSVIKSMLVTLSKLPLDTDTIQQTQLTSFEIADQLLNIFFDGALQ